MENDKKVKGKPAGPKPTEGKADPQDAKEDATEAVPAASLGSIVFYTTAVGTVRPAITTRVYEDPKVADLVIFNSAGAVPAEEVPFSGEGLPGTYHHLPESS